MEYDLVNRCDNFCPWCAGFHGLNRADKTTWNKGNVGQSWKLDEAKDVLYQLYDLRVKAVTFTGGGEPMMSPHIVELIQYADSLTLDVALITNGKRLTLEKAEQIFPYCEWVRVSVDASNPKEYEEQHGMFEKDWHSLLDNIEKIAVHKGDCTLGIAFLTNGLNDDSIMPFAELGKGLGVDYAQFRPQHLTTDQHTSKTLKMISNAIETYADDPDYNVVCSEHKYQKIGDGNVGRYYTKCYGQHFAGVIAADHKLYACCHMRGIEKYCIGDLRKQTLKEIWYSKKKMNMEDVVDVTSSDCIPLCRGDSFNEILFPLKQPITHANFI